MKTPSTSAHDKKIKIVSASHFVPATPHEIFELLANPAMHAVIDGSGSVMAAKDAAPKRLSQGATFSMSMKRGAPYKMTNTVVEFVEDKQIGWRHFGGHVWRYILEPTTGGTTVTEQFSYGTSKSPLTLKLAGYIKGNEKAIKQTLANLADYFVNKK
ncbi:MAG: dimethyladenosine transferase [Actinobacteria bacterium]|nr:dimethyladenosine transferase [Actinomycetota bacterium]